MSQPSDPTAPVEPAPVTMSVAAPPPEPGEAAGPTSGTPAPGPGRGLPPRDPAPPPAALGAVRSGPLATLAAFVLVLLAVLALKEVAPLLVPILFGLFIALVAWPLVAVLERRGIRHALALTGAIAVVLAIVLVTAGVIAFSVAELVLQVPRYQDRLTVELDGLRSLLGQAGISLDQEAVTSVISPGEILAYVRPFASAISSAGATIFILLVTLIYALAGGRSLRGRAQAAFGADHRLLRGVEHFGVDLRRYLLVRALLGLFAAVLSFVLLFVLGVPFAALWAFLVFAASFIPNIGFIIALIPPLILAFLEGGILPAVAVILGYVAINFLQDHFLQPVVMGSELNLSPLVVMLSVIAWTWILGAAGALLAVPLTLMLVLVLEAWPSTARLAALMRSRSDEPPGLVDHDDGPPAPPAAERPSPSA